MTKRILIVDDDADLARTMAEVLELEGYATAVAGNGREALEQLQQAPRPDLILLDMMMPVMDGWAFRETQQRLEDVASIPVIAVTADGNARGKAAAIRAAGCIAKPVAIDDLVAVVTKICGGPGG